MELVAITDAEFRRVRTMIHERAGISLSDAKRALVAGRLAKRLRHFGLGSFSDYLSLLGSGEGRGELQTMVDLLTTNETYFFRESAHFDFLAEQVLATHPAGAPLEIWSAACSSGEEVYTLAMVLAEHLGLERPWRITGTDLSTRVLALARSGHYPMSRARGLPEYYLKKYCLKGVRSAEGTFLIAPELRARTRFAQVNLIEPLPKGEPCDVIFLRNVMIYFDPATKRQVVDALIDRLRPGGHLIVGHSETLHGFSERLRLVRPTIYRRER
ncbi:protein-glutamate O-methyltransferase [Nitrogeniibacter mangrovi]|uniref:Chemotaxis protein methyltransferase n=1 Tax=Nitrogeniibacter mangrovi TaxID=2016596 RepID=A0A6C1AZR0_9RHOO|nr:protein-glutamate O-methyltransferase [Nitrogeniibacter mangrovi]QID16807.1 protein-glutamate O-methyltransferase [Nitrogeniibacter mangrovi]